MTPTSSQPLSAWQQLNQDPRFVLRRKQTIDYAHHDAFTDAAEVKFENQAQLICYRRDELAKCFEDTCKELYAIAKHVWLSHGRKVTPEFLRSVLEEGMIPRLDKRLLYFIIRTDFDGEQAFRSLDNDALRRIDIETDWILYAMEHRLRLMVEIDAADAAPLLHQTKDSPIVESSKPSVTDGKTNKKSLRESSPEPLTLEQLRKRPSLSQSEAAAALGYKSTRQIRKLREAHKLTKVAGGRIANDDTFQKLYRKRHNRIVG
jgi:hypothetical protein